MTALCKERGRKGRGRRAVGKSFEDGTNANNNGKTPSSVLSCLYVCRSRANANRRRVSVIDEHVMEDALHQALPIGPHLSTRTKWDSGKFRKAMAELLNQHLAEE